MALTTEARLQINKAASVAPVAGTVTLLVTGAERKAVTIAVVVPPALRQPNWRSPTNSVMPSARIVAGPGSVEPVLKALAVCVAQPDTWP